MESQKESEFECAICFQLLLDPVVGVCGHDFCRSCLVNWAATSTSSSNSGVNCPLCRSELAPDSEGVKKLGVCFRLKRMLENMYPDKIAARRQEKTAEEARLAQAQRAAHQQSIRQGRARYIRARRTRNTSAAPPLGSSPLQPASPSSFALFAPPQLAFTSPGFGTPGSVTTIPQVVTTPASLISPVTTSSPWQAPGRPQPLSSSPWAGGRPPARTPGANASPTVHALV